MDEPLESAMPSFHRSLRVESRSGRQTGDPGVVLLREVPERSGIMSWMPARLDAFGCNEVWRLGQGRQPAVGGPSGRRIANNGSTLLAHGQYHDYARTSELSIGPSLATGTGTGGQQSLTVLGRIFPGQRPSIGIYSDSVVVTVSY